jgi:Asp-tRNA(Asn)/Glu-tRNA(Gln) amidotransferase A subunit family amidase
MKPGASARAAVCAVALTSALASLSGQSAPPLRPVAVEEKSIAELGAMLASGAATSQEITAAFLARIDAYDRQGPKLNAMIALNPRALEIAAALDRERKETGVRGPLHGIPIVIKDNYETADMPTTGGSMALAGFETGRDAFMVKKLRDAGAVLIGKTNLHELAAGIITVSSLGGQTLNPYDPQRTPGGSSGGSAAAVAANFAPAGMASDTCGSIRIPAANNNLFGLRGTAGLSSRTGIIPLSHTQDIGGPVARSVADLAVVLDATVGEDPADAVTKGQAARVPRFGPALEGATLKDVRIGVLKNLFGSAPEDEEVAGIVRKALDLMKAQGAVTVDVTIAGLDETLQGSSLINLEFKSDLIQYLGQFPKAPVKSLADILIRGEFHAALETTFKARNNTAVDPDAIRRAMVRRAATAALVTAALDEHRLDALAYPTLRRRPVVVQEPQRGTNCQLSASTGFPAMAMPAGFTDDGVPIGFELLGPAWSDARLLALAFAYERAASPRRPPPTAPALVAGKVPGPVTFEVTGSGTGPLRITFRYDRLTGTLAYDVGGLAAGEGLLAGALHRGAPGADGATIARLFPPLAPAASGSIVLPPYQRTWLEQGRVFVSVRTAAPAARALTAVLRPPLS